MNAHDLCERYVSLWNEPDPGVRRERIRELWTTSGYQLLAPPEDVRQSARTLAMTATRASRSIGLATCLRKPAP